MTEHGARLREYLARTPRRNAREKLGVENASRTNASVRYRRVQRVHVGGP